MHKLFRQLLPYALLIAGAIWIWTSRTEPGEINTGSPAAPIKGFNAPDFTLQTPAGEEVNLASLQGKPVIINFWASWCPPCRAEMPALERVYQAYQSQGITILAINATNQDNRQEALDFITANHLSFTVLLDLDGAVNEIFAVRSLPTTFFIDATGVIREVVIGGPMSEALLRVQIEQLLSEGTQ
ncbi:MAG: redoxin domain-containing protein [Anaerolineales bacterium]|nr:redoxin domain-containing protein [Anaerolineales bacterium]